MPVSVVGPLLNQAPVCVPILRMLPEWFGLETGILNYEREIGSLPTFLANQGNRIVGFLSLKQHTPYSAEILVMAMQPGFQRCGGGRALVIAAEAYARSQAIEYLQVKTLGPSRPDAGYAKTRAFYEAVGFRALEEFTQIWDEGNPCLIMVKRS